ncbi:hypothetical protein ACFL6U_17305, partial [Planctomycetota bacterium]
ISRKLIVISLIVGVFLAGNILVIAQWLADKGIPETASWIRSEFLTGTAITIVIALLILQVSPKQRAIGFTRRCPVCDHALLTRGSYCSECGSKTV